MNKKDIMRTLLFPEFVKNSCLIEEAKKEVGMVIESIDNIEVAKRLSDELNLELPILNTVYDILYNNLEPKKAVEMLMTRKKKQED